MLSESVDNDERKEQFLSRKIHQMQRDVHRVTTSA
jgi:hypothetical protein